MIPNAKLRIVESSPIEASGEFGISLDNSAHIMTILRDTMYSDKILAVLREYGANAWDSHREAGKDNLPIKIILPTQMEPTLTIRDFGTGLSQDDVFTIFTQYGASTKRTSDRSVGMLGIGSKSGFAYSDSFTVTSYNGGMKKTYVAVLDASEKGMINLLHEEPCGEETGLAIQIAIRHEDIREFEEKAKGLYQYFVPKPEINTTLPEMPPAQASLVHGVIFEDDWQRSSKWVAIMGCISYRINLDQLHGMDTTPEGGVAAFLNDLSGALYFNIGDVLVAASREELRYVDRTKVELVKKFNLLVEEYVRHTLANINTGEFTPWERRVKAQVLNRLRLPVPTDCKDVTSKSVSLKDIVPDSLTVTRYNKTVATSVNVERESRFVICDNSRSLNGFRLGSDDYQVRKTKETSWDQMETDLWVLLEKAGLLGITVVRLSELNWFPPTKTWNGKTINAKHRQRTFKLKEGCGFRSPWSKCWEFEEREPTVDDVFVIINQFKTDEFSLSQFTSEDKKLIRIFGGIMPTIYGYKTTEKKPIEPKDCIGTYYPEWRKEFVKTFLTAEVMEMLEHWNWSQAISTHWGSREKSDKKASDFLVKHLGDSHPITNLFRRTLEGKEFFKKKEDIPQALEALQERLNDMKTVNPAEVELKAIHATYPLLTITDISELWGEHSSKWLHYIQMVDRP